MSESLNFELALCLITGPILKTLVLDVVWSRVKYINKSYNWYLM